MRTLLPAVALLTSLLAAMPTRADLSDEFKAPPAEARPLTWWHWLNGNITSNGITRDLEAMKRAGLGGCYLFNCGGAYPQGDVRFLQPAWLGMMDHTLREAERLGLKFGIHNCDGFSQSGGPWITPEMSMKELTWTALEVEGGKAIEVTLPQPDAKEGFYRDIAVVAFPRPEGGPLTGARLGGSLPAAELHKLADGRPGTQAAFAPGQHAVTFTFAEPQVVRSLTVRNADPQHWEEDFPLRLEVSDDGTSFRPAGEFTVNWDYSDAGQATAAFADTTGRVFRVAFTSPWRVQIGEMELSSAAKVHFAEAKAARLRSRGHGAEARHHLAYPGPDRHRPLASNRVVAADAVCDLTRAMGADGRLKWTVPPGRWRLLRVGYTSNGHYVSPATPEGRGLECDKLDPAAVRFHLDRYVGQLIARAGPAAGRTLAAVEIDSWECGIQDWTAGFETRFRDRLGYDLRPWWPALLEGWIVNDADQTERMLWDWRRFLADQFSASYFATAADYLQKKGVTYVGESTGRQQYLYDVGYLRNSAVPMGEFWIDSGPGQGVRVDNKVASSIAHTAGRKVVASESYTASPGAARWQNHPFSLKAEGDRAFCAGVNQFVFHTFAHQPYEATGPGFTFFFWGLNFNRGNTWFEAAGGWMDYLARCNQLLRQGQQVCDVLWFVGEDVPNRIGWRDELRPALPAGYDFDGADARAVLEARVTDGRIVLPSGAAYRVQLLPDLPTMRPAVAQKVLELAQAGAVIVAPRRPAQSPALGDRGAGDETVERALAALWDGTAAPGRLFAGRPFAEVFQQIGLPPDFTCRGSAGADILYVHRQADGADLFFVANQSNRTESVEALFRVTGKEPELWDPVTGALSKPTRWQREPDGRTSVALTLDPCGSVFVVFRPQPTAGLTVAAAPQVLRPVEGPWSVTFPPGLGAPASATFDRLASWPERAEEGIRHFSGTATYEKDIDIPAADLAAGRALVLDLGDVQVIARVELNGQALPTLWMPPYRVRIDAAARPGPNHLRIRVTNLWVNRLLGDAALPDDMAWQSAKRGSSLPSRWPDWLLHGTPRPSGRIAFCTRKDVYQAGDSLLPSGLLGPVTLLGAATGNP